MTWVKICGMTRAEDVAAAVAAGADAVGFVAHPASSRFVSPAVITALAGDTEVATYLVTVDADPAWLVSTAATVGVTGVQPHGRESSEAIDACLAVGLDVLAPVPVAGTPPDLSAIPEGATPILDTAADAHGGTGTSFDWGLAEGLDRSIVLAGGLHPDNVAAAVARVEPWGVDVASGVEAAPGVKDHDAMRRFVEAARS